MNQNTTIETIREAIDKITKSLTHCRDLETSLPLLREARTELCKLANRLEAAPPFGQPPVEQSEPTHPLHAGYLVTKDGEEREWLIGSQTNERGRSICPNCKQLWQALAPECDNCGATQHSIGRYSYWLAPPAVIEPEPELDEFERAIYDARDGNFFKDAKDALEYAVMQYREIISRKGDK